jgi:phage host-nuclease inhibitor protein Gam
MARRKTTTRIIADERQAEAAMRELAALGRQIAAIDLDAQEALDQVKANAKDEMQPLQDRRKELENALCTFCELNKGELFSRKRSKETPFGVYGFRKSTKLLTAAKVTLGLVLERLKELNLTDAIRVKESVDKEAMREWPEERLEAVGMRRKSTDEFFVEIDLDQLEERA